MHTEIEKKFLLFENGTPHLSHFFRERVGSLDRVRAGINAQGVRIRQGYLSEETSRELRLELGMNVDFVPIESRVREEADDRYFSVKAGGGISRRQASRKIDRAFFDRVWPLTAGRRISKRRWTVELGAHRVEIDLFDDRDLIVAEVEVTSLEDALSVPELGRDVTSDDNYKNRNLAR